MFWPFPRLCREWVVPVPAEATSLRRIWTSIPTEAVLPTRAIPTGTMARVGSPLVNNTPHLRRLSTVTERLSATFTSIDRTRTESGCSAIATCPVSFDIWGWSIPMWRGIPGLGDLPATTKARSSPATPRVAFRENMASSEDWLEATSLLVLSPPAMPRGVCRAGVGSEDWLETTLRTRSMRRAPSPPATPPFKCPAILKSAVWQGPTTAPSPPVTPLAVCRARVRSEDWLVTASIALPPAIGTRELRDTSGPDQSTEPHCVVRAWARQSYRRPRDTRVYFRPGIWTWTATAHPMIPGTSAQRTSIRCCL